MRVYKKSLLATICLSLSQIAIMLCVWLFCQGALAQIFMLGAVFFTFDILKRRVKKEALKVLHGKKNT